MFKILHACGRKHITGKQIVTKIKSHIFTRTMIEVDNIYLYLIQIKGKLKKLDGKMFKVAKNVVELRPHQVLY